MAKFEVGKSYKNAFGDIYQVVSKTAKSVVVYSYHAGSTFRKTLETVDGVEAIMTSGIGVVRADIAA